jgi:uncharacterized membrane protein YhaH (DUF805 family)
MRVAWFPGGISQSRERTEDMAIANPYDAPKAQVAGARDAEYGKVRIFTSQGRIGRLRYIGYSTGLPFLIMLAVGVVSGILGGATGNTAFAWLVIAGYVAVMIVAILLTIQRCHDMGKSGWLALLLVVPLVNLIFWFIPGTDGENRFGLKPPPNGAGVVVLALIFPILAVVGIVAAIALPAYQDYVKRAQVQQSQ